LESAGQFVVQQKTAAAALTYWLTPGPDHLPRREAPGRTAGAHSGREITVQGADVVTGFYFLESVPFFPAASGHLGDVTPEE